MRGVACSQLIDLFSRPLIVNEAKNIVGDLSLSTRRTEVLGVYKWLS